MNNTTSTINYTMTNEEYHQLIRATRELTEGFMAYDKKYVKPSSESVMDLAVMFMRFNKLLEIVSSMELVEESADNTEQQITYALAQVDEGYKKLENLSKEYYTKLGYSGLGPAKDNFGTAHSILEKLLNK